MKPKHLFFAAASLLLVYSACKKKTTDDPNNPTIDGKNNQQIFMMQPWKIGSWTDSSDGNTDDVLSSEITLKDDKYTFNSTNKYNLNRGANRLSGDLESEDLNWSMASATGDKVNIPDLGGEFTITGKTNTSISLQRDFMLGAYLHRYKLVFGKY